MAMQTITVELPEEIISLLGSPESARQKAHRAIVIELLREARISQGKAAELLGISKWDMNDLMVEYKIYSGPETPEELAEEIRTARRIGRAR